MDHEHVFIVGCPRTGSTLLRQILNKSERVCITSETHFLRRISRVGMHKRILRFGDLGRDENVERLIDFLYAERNAEIRGYWNWFYRQVDRQEFRRRLLETDRSDREIFALLMRIYAEARRVPLADDLILGEKTPMHLYYVPTLFEWFPRVKIIHTFRDPRAIFASALKRVKSGKWGPKGMLPSSVGRLLDPLLDPLEVLHVTKIWFDAVKLHAQYERAYPGRYHLVRFEDMIAEPEEQVRQVCNFLEIPYESRLMDGIAVVGSSYHAQHRTGSGIDQSAVRRWEEHINPLARAWFSILGRKHLEKFGYAP
jgi:hypothetical protein